jgi:hypothetical protein
MGVVSAFLWRPPSTRLPASEFLSYLSSRISWLLGSLAPWLPGSLAPWLPGSLAPWLLGSLAPWLLPTPIRNPVFAVLR